MAIIKCKMCGGDIELAADKTFGTCEYCGSTMTFPKLDDELRVKRLNETSARRRQLNQQKFDIQGELAHMGVFGNRARKQELQAQLQKVEKELQELH